MMTFEEILQALKDNENVKRQKWTYIEYMHLDLVDGIEIYVDNEFIPYRLSYNDLFADDWEIL
jgi:hypothetical protein